MELFKKNSKDQSDQLITIITAKDNHICKIDMAYNTIHLENNSLFRYLSFGQTKLSDI